jgi:hypothetical protein
MKRDDSINDVKMKSGSSSKDVKKRREDFLNAVQKPVVLQTVYLKDESGRFRLRGRVEGICASEKVFVSTDKSMSDFVLKDYSEISLRKNSSSRAQTFNDETSCGNRYIQDVLQGLHTDIGGLTPIYGFKEITALVYISKHISGARFICTKKGFIRADGSGAKKIPKVLQSELGIPEGFIVVCDGAEVVITDVLRPFYQNLFKEERRAVIHNWLEKTKVNGGIPAILKEVEYFPVSSYEEISSLRMFSGEDLVDVIYPCQKGFSVGKKNTLRKHGFTTPFNKLM